MRKRGRERKYRDLASLPEVIPLLRVYFQIAFSKVEMYVWKCTFRILGRFQVVTEIFRLYLRWFTKHKISSRYTNGIKEYWRDN